MSTTSVTLVAYIQMYIHKRIHSHHAHITIHYTSWRELPCTLQYSRNMRVLLTNC